ncbi:unnamed protein product [Lactuca virosa]|uniref:Uncharacterized protein n=1 Tax=Lactuca virosa TaxID=75947 RepID=A0AAU9N7R1_9ASTR|nr:unnamed protein product [Lactuca virosa]
MSNSLWRRVFAAVVEGGKQAVKEQVASGKFNLQEPSIVVEMTQAMYASVRSFMETDFASLLRLVELDLEGLPQLCRDPDVECNPTERDPFKVGSSYIALGK